jgi:hypothetical protein
MRFLTAATVVGMLLAVGHVRAKPVVGTDTGEALTPPRYDSRSAC